MGNELQVVSVAPVNLGLMLWSLAVSSPTPAPDAHKTWMFAQSDRSLPKSGTDASGNDYLEILTAERSVAARERRPGKGLVLRRQARKKIGNA